MKLQSASRKEIARISVGTLVCSVIMIAVLWLLSQFGIGKFEFFRILLGALCGSAIAIINFTILCLTVQMAVGMENKNKMKRRFQLSYNLRLLIQAGWVVAAFMLKPIHFVAAAAPIFFPNVVILYLQFKGKLVPADPPREPAAAEPAENETSQD